MSWLEKNQKINNRRRGGGGGLFGNREYKKFFLLYVWGWKLAQVDLDSTNNIFETLDFLMFDQIFLSPQVKRNVVISNKQGKY